MWRESGDEKVGHTGSGLGVVGLIWFVASSAARCSICGFMLASITWLTTLSSSSIFIYLSLYIY